MCARIVPALLAAAALAVAGCGSGDVAKEASQPSARGDAKDSLLRTANFRRALAALRRRVGPAATLASLRLEPGALKAEVEGGAGRSVVVTRRLVVTSVETPGVTPSGPGVGLARVDAGAPERIVAGARATLRDVDYLLLAGDPASTRPVWALYLRRGRGEYSADLTGANVKPLAPGGGATTGTTTVTTPPPATTSTPTIPQPASTPTNPRSATSTSTAQRQAECVRKAGISTPKIQACLKLR